MTTDYKVVGPFAQTLFLGCSITEISMNMAWGSENSSCQVSLVRDPMSHEAALGYGSLHSAMSGLANSADSKNRITQLPGDLASQDALKPLNKFEIEKVISHNLKERNISIDKNIRDIGKKLWNPHEVFDSLSQPKHWLGSDPGFIGEAYSIMGCPCQVRFQDLSFCGFINKWSFDNAKYSVELAGPGSLLRGVKLILGDYYGTISTLVQQISIPYGDVTAPGVLDSFQSTIAQGNIPNLINIFGFLENAGWGNSRTTEFGINASRVYDALIELLSSDVVQNNAFSPYGGILSRGAMSLSRGLLDTNIKEFRDAASFTSFSLTDFGLLRTVPSMEQLPRCIFKLDLSSVPRPSENLSLPQSNQMSLDEFINFCCAGAGFDWNTELIPDTDIDSKYTGTIKINTYSRRIQPPPSVLKNFIRDFDAKNNVVSYDFGEEYKDQNVRKVVFGGKQERLYQVSSHTLSRYKSSKIFNPINGEWLNPTTNIDNAHLINDKGHISNVVKIPLADSQRTPNVLGDEPLFQSYTYRSDGAAITAQGSEDVNQMQTSAMGIPYAKGNYKVSTPQLSLIRDPLGGVLGGGIDGKVAYPIHLDLISPYFGRDINGNMRKVFYDRSRQQLLINAPLSDLNKVFPLLTLSGGYITIYENEIRAALASFDSWLTYIFEPTKYQIWRPTARLLWTVIEHIAGRDVAESLRLKGAGATKDQGKERNPFGTYHTGNSISPSQSILFSNTIMPMLQGVFQYITQELGQHYSKNYAVRLPNVKRYVGEDGVPRYDWEITESGWEENGNVIDDTMVIGRDIEASLIALENGKFGPILGWNNSEERDYSWPTIGDLNVVAAASVSNMRGILKGLASMTGKIDNTNTRYKPLNTDADGINFRVLRSTTDSFGANIPAIDKFYQKASILDISPENLVNKKIFYDSFIGASYCVIAAPGPVTLHSRDFLVKTIYEDCAVQLMQGSEEASYYSNIDLGYMFQRFLSNATGTGSYLMFMVALLDGAFHSSPGAGVSMGLNNESNMPIYSRAAIPCFAAIPVRYNTYLYGPWSTAPQNIASVLFPSINRNNPMHWANNVVGGVDVSIEPQYVPWEYGGMDKLDAAVLKQLNDANEYQQVEENGKITLAGIMLNNTRIGQKFQGSGPVCNGAVVTFGPDGIRTTYSFRTFSRKLGYFNKENAENIQRFGKQALAIKSTIVENINTLRQLTNSSSSSSGPGYFRPKSMNFSPVSILVGAAYPFIPKNSTVTNFKEQLKFDHAWPANPFFPSGVTTADPKHITAVSIYDPAEMDRSLLSDEERYAGTSVMSLDGIFSPVSLYPTKQHSTYALSKYRRSKCPMCAGTNVYNYESINETALRNSTKTSSSEGISSYLTISTGPCPYCIPDKDIETLKAKGTSLGAETNPPFLIGSGTDRYIIADMINLGNNRTMPVINNYSYNPIVLSTSGVEFSCDTLKQSGDACGYSIDAVSFGNVLPKPNDALRAALSDNPNKNYEYLDTNAVDPNRAQNYRFFGLRGPVILHSWGYDLEGYPVPNSSGEPKIINGGEIVRDTNGNMVGKNQQLQSDGTWSAPFKEHTFMKGWAQQPASWHTGPIDFRWDSEARVWTIGSNNYKPVWVVLEHDLVDENPVRAIVVDSTYSNNPLPSGLRRLVFVKDTAGVFSAPRGASLYCKYNSSNGFYEPVYNRLLVTSGLIEGARTATIYTAYVPSMVSDDIVSEYRTVYDNPLDLPANTNSVGLFIFVNGKWLLQGSKV